MKEGIRAHLKAIIPSRFWPFLRFFDKYIIDLLYWYFLVKRLSSKFRFRGIKSSCKQSIFSFLSKIELKSHETDTLSSLLKKHGCDVLEGRHSVYLYRREDIQLISPELCDFYPYSFGLKIIKSQEFSPDGSPYYTSRKLAPASSFMSMRAVGSVKEKVVISNLLNMKNVAPRVYDIIKLQSGGVIVYALVVKHIDGKTVTGRVGFEFIRKLERILQKMGIKVLGIKNHKDFRPPDFRNNIVADKSGTYYVDIQNFVMFDNSLMKKRLSGAFSIQLDSTFFLFKEYFERNRLNIRQRTVLADGFNSVAFTMFALSKGARWCVILDHSGMAEQIQSILYYYGFSRFDVVKCKPQEVKIDLLPITKYDYVYCSSDEALDSLPNWLETIDCQILFYEVLDMAHMGDIKKRLEKLPLDCTVVGVRKDKKTLTAWHW